MNNFPRLRLRVGKVRSSQFLQPFSAPKAKGEGTMAASEQEVGLALHFISQTKVGIGTGSRAQTGKALWPRLGWAGSVPSYEWGRVG